MKLESGKTYVFKDDACRDEYLTNHCTNRINVDSHYKDGFALDRVDDQGCGYIGDSWVMDESEYHLFKEKESEPFDISEYEFSDDGLRFQAEDLLAFKYKSWGDHQDGVEEELFFDFSKQDAEAMAKHFKLI